MRKLNILDCLIAILALNYLGVAHSQEVLDSQIEESSAALLEIEHTEIEKNQFRLTDKEVSRAKRLRHLDRSFGVENLSAVELLGKYAKTDAERLKYARKHVTAMADNVGRAQAWGMAVYEATQEINLVEEILSTNPMIEAGLNRMRMAVPRSDYSDFDKPPIVKTEPGRTLMMSLKCGDECDQEFAEQFVLVMENKVDHLDVVFVGSSNSDTDAIFAWAKSMAISKKVLEAGNVNLHIDDVEWKEMRNGQDSVPRLIRQ